MLSVLDAAFVTWLWGAGVLKRPFVFWIRCSSTSFPFALASSVLSELSEYDGGPRVCVRLCEP